VLVAPLIRATEEDEPRVHHDHVVGCEGETGIGVVRVIHEALQFVVGDGQVVGGARVHAVPYAD
jgi:hypothetical protein